MNTKLLNAAVTKAMEYCDTNNIKENVLSIQQRILEWYNNTKITDIEILAAAALEFDSFTCLPFDVLTQIAADYFPRFAVWEENNTCFEF